MSGTARQSPISLQCDSARRRLVLSRIIGGYRDLDSRRKYTGRAPRPKLKPFSLYGRSWLSQESGPIRSPPQLGDRTVGPSL